MKYILQTDNETIEIPIIRSKRKTLGLEVKYDSTVNARVPMRAPREIIERFIREHEAWIIRKRQEWSLSGNNRDDMSGLPPIETKVSLTASAEAEGYIEEGYAFSPMFKIGYKKTISDKEVFATWLNLEKAN